MRRLIFSLISIYSLPAFAVESHIIYNPQGTAVFEVRFFDETMPIRRRS
ncbi:hypothetical protein FHU14_003382 [Mesorhizobium sp. RMAD-H1]|nr:hypothetical protein [Mesorhizobium sp. RMAD-H1]